jgi:glycerophosphoryl diester phosphodiesterase
VARQLVRIAHAYGNRRPRISAAIEAGVDLIEADLRYWRGEIWIRHEHRPSRLPLVYNVGLKPGIHRQGPWAARLGKLFVRADLSPIRFGELLDRVSGRAGLLIDLKAAPYPPRVARAFVERVFSELDEHRFAGALDFCGGWPLLDVVHAMRPDLPLHYSVDSLADWHRLQSRLAGSGRIPGISLRCDLIEPGRIATLRAAHVDYYCWDIKDAQDASRAIEAGASGIIADDLVLLRNLAGTAVRDLEDQ